MNANELRIGNIVTYHGETDMDCVLDAIDIFNIATKYMHNDEIHSPIVITEEWLLKFGFKKPAHSWNGDKFHLSEWDAYPLNWCVAMNKNGAVLVEKLKYVHQLQNLYFALTGEELTIKTI